MQFLYLKRIVENNAFDQIYHEHLLYYNLRTLARLLDRHGLAQRESQPSHARQEQPTIERADWWLTEPDVGGDIDGMGRWMDILETHEPR